MKNALFATTALVAAAAAGAASANEGIKASVGGYMNIGAGFATSDAPNQDGAVIIREGEIHFNFKGVADNGLTFGGRVELEAATTGDQIDENYAYVEGSFGRLEIGGNDEARTRMGTGLLYGPSAWGGYFDQKNLIGFGYNAVNDTDNLGIYYFTPNFQGFQAAVSYQPEAGTDGAGGDGNVAFDNDNDVAGEDAWSFGANYTGSFEGFDLSLGGGYTTRDGSNQDRWSVGATAGTAGITFAAYYQDEPAAAAGEWVALGLGYETGPWSLGGGVSFNVDGATDELMIGAFGGYALAPGVTAGALFEYGSSDRGAVELDGTAGAVFLALSF